MASRRTSKKTRKIYAGKLNKWIQYFDQKYPQLVIREAEADDPENIKVYVDVDELTAAHVNAFLGTLSRDAITIQNSDVQAGTPDIFTLIEDKAVLANQTVSGHVIALRNAFRDHKIDIPLSVKKAADDFLDGYKKVIADLKSKGKSDEVQRVS